MLRPSDHGRVNKLLKNVAAKFMAELSNLTEAKRILQNLNWLPIRQRIQFKVLCLVHKELLGNGHS